MNTTACAMYDEGPLSGLITKWQTPRQPRGDKPEMERIEMLEEFLKKVRVQGKFNDDRVKPIWGVAHTDLGSKSPQDWKMLTVAEVKFFCEVHPRSHETVKRQVSVGWWFSEAYGKVLNPKGLVVNVGQDKKPVSWPVELCFVLPGQSYKHLLLFSEQAQRMITFACNTPPQNINFIQGEGLSMLGVQRQPGSSVGVLADPPLEVFMTMSEIAARRIPAPQLQLKGQSISSQDASTGQWNLKGRKFKESATKKYAVLVIKHLGEPPIINLDDFKNTLPNGISNYCGVQLKPFTVPGVSDALDWPEEEPLTWLTKLFNYCGENGVEYCFIIPSDPKWYIPIKSVADLVGMQTTISLGKKDNTVKSKPGEIANLLLKYNLKCGGVNWSLNMSDFKVLGGRPTMFLGADVIHPPPGAMKGAPSCAALVASIGPNPAQFPGVVELQHNPDDKKEAMEMILKLDSMVESRLLIWYDRNKGVLPKQLVMYRDGVSDAQLQQSLDEELPLMMEACQTVYHKFNQTLPKIIWQVCQKRHIVHFYQPKGDRSRTFDPKGNPLPGLIVDQNIVSKNHYD